MRRIDFSKKPTGRSQGGQLEAAQRNAGNSFRKTSHFPLLGLNLLCNAMRLDLVSNLCAYVCSNRFAPITLHKSEPGVEARIKEIRGIKGTHLSNPSRNRRCSSVVHAILRIDLVCTIASHPQRETAALKITSVASLAADLLAGGFFGCGSSSDSASPGYRLARGLRWRLLILAAGRSV